MHTSRFLPFFRVMSVIMAVSTVSASRAVRASLSPAGIGIQQVIRQVADRLEFSTSSTCVRPPREVRWLLA